MIPNWQTAFITAYCRALETKRREPLFSDPLAEVLVEEVGEKIQPAVPSEDLLAKVIAVRTRIVDDYIRDALDRGVDEIINLGAGLDTRPYRLPLPSSLIWVEADLPELILYKDTKLQGEVPHCQVRRISLDMNNHQNLADFLEAAVTEQHAQNVLVLTEGFISYLTPGQVGRLADELSRFPEVRYWITDYVRREALTKLEKFVAFKFTPADWFEFFERHGWTLEKIRYLARESERLERPITHNATSQLAGFALLKRRGQE